MAELGVRIKICGLTDCAEAIDCVAAGADWIGLNFYPASPRCLEADRAKEIVRSLPLAAEAVGVFVDCPPQEVAAIADRVGLGIVQLHGDEPPEDIVALAHLRVVRAFRIRDAGSVEAMAGYLRRSEELGRPPDAVLVDAFAAGQAGGTGRTIAESLLSLLPAHSRLILAGGLTPENVAERITRSRPWMVDVASGVESAPGRKDRQRVAAFVRAVAEASQRSGSPLL